LSDSTLKLNCGVRILLKSSLRVKSLLTTLALCTIARYATRSKKSRPILTAELYTEMTNGHSTFEQGISFGLCTPQFGMTQQKFYCHCE